LGLGIYDTVNTWGSKNTAEKVSAVAGDLSSLASTASGALGIATTFSSTFSKALSTAGPLAHIVPGLNIAAGVASAISDGASAISDFQKGNYITGTIDTVAAIGDALSCAPPPLGLVGAGVSLAAGGLKILGSIFHWK